MEAGILFQREDAADIINQFAKLVFRGGRYLANVCFSYKFGYFGEAINLIVCLFTKKNYFVYELVSVRRGSVNEPKIFHQLHLAHRAIFRAADRALALQFDITSQQHGVLLFLSKNEGATMGQLASALGLRNAATSGLVDRMEKKQLLERKPSATDGRSFAVHMMAAGKKIVKDSKQFIAQANTEILKGFSSDDKIQLAEYLKQITKQASAAP